jgi:hypothetical protein
MSVFLDEASAGARGPRKRVWPDRFRLALVEVYEVVSFHAPFDIVMDDEKPSPPLTVRVCQCGSARG